MKRLINFALNPFPPKEQSTRLLWPRLSVNTICSELHGKKELEKSKDLSAGKAKKKKIKKRSHMLTTAGRF